MSAKADSRLRLLYKLHERLVRVRWTSDSIDIRTLSGGKRDVKTLAEAFTLYCCLLVDLGYGFDESISVIEQLSHCDVTKVFKVLKDLDDTLLAFLGEKSGTMRSVRELELCFKHIAADLTCFIPVITHFCHDLCSDRGIISFRYLHQIFAFLSRVSLITVDGSKDIDDFLCRNQSLRKVNVEIAHKLDIIISDLLQGVDFEPWGHHGSGSTCDAGRVSPIEKTLFIKPDKLHEYVYLHFLKKDIRDYIPFDNVIDGVGERTAYVTTVPKTALKRRIIAVESVTQQWFQQLVMRALYQHIRKYIPNIPLYNQEIQRYRAYVGSCSGKYATIDLSAASDSISWDLVKIAFKHSGVLPYLYMTRSRLIHVNKDCVPLNIYATMGSACCFPVMCILLYAICVLVSNDAGCRKCDCTVYGDDIICPVEIVSGIHHILEELGFQMNTRKSYFDDRPLTFRESCGAEYYAGFDVTPLRLARNFTGQTVSESPGSFVERVDLANALHSHGYYLTRQWVISVLLDQCTPPPIFGDFDGQIHTDEKATNYLAAYRWNSDYQRSEYMVTTTTCGKYQFKHICSTDYTIDNRLKVYRDYDYLYACDDRVKSLIDHLSYFLWWSSRPYDGEQSAMPIISNHNPAASGPIQLTTEWIHTY